MPWAALSRTWRVGRVMTVMTYARRGTLNTDANLSIEQENANNYYKDRIRTIEFKARMALNKARAALGNEQKR